MPNLPAIQESDMTESDLIKVKTFMEEGMPGLANVTNAQLYRMYDMYLTGSTYSQISTMLGIKRTVILYLSHNSGWYDSKQEHMREIQESIKNRVAESKVKNKEFMLLLVQSFRKKIGHKLANFLATNDEQHMDDIDLKEIAQLMKAIEIVDGLNNEGKDSKGKTPAVGINVGDGVTVEKTGENTISITPKEHSIGDMLKQHADSMREKERKVLTEVKSHDINDNKEQK